MRVKAWIGETSDKGATYRLGDVPTPDVRAGELLVRVKATGLNRVDQRPKPSHFSHTDAAPAAIPGLEMAGEVVAIASDVSGFRIGERVMAMVQGGAAELARIHHSLAIKIPSDVSWETASAIPISYLTAYDAVVMRGHFHKGDHLLVHAVTSGVGIACAQIGTIRGAASIGGSSSSADKLKAARTAGVTYGILDPAKSFAQTVMENTGGHGADVVIDNIGGSILNETIRSTAFSGRVIDVGRLGGTMANIDLDLLAVRRVSLIGVTFRTRSLAEHAEICERFMSDHADDIQSGRLKPVIAQSFGFADLPQAIECARAGKTLGKVVLTH